MTTPALRRSLTPTEARWVDSLRRVMARCPQTLDLSTMGDACLTVLDRELARLGPIEDGYAFERGADLASIPCACVVHGVSG